MGTEGKSRKRGSPSISEDEGKRKKHRTRDDKERKSKRKKDQERSKKSHKHSRDDSDKGMKASEKRDRKHHKKGSRSKDFQELSNDDYFSKNNEFSTWLKEEKGVFFSDLSSEDARKLFSGFVKDWNRQKLQSRYYEGIANGPRSAHSWKIADKK